MPTAARSRVGTSWTASSGKPAAAMPRRRHAAMTRRRSEALGTAAQDHGVAGAQAQAAGIGGDVRPRFVDDADDADRNAHARDVEPVGARPAREFGADRIGQRRHRFEPGGHLFDPLARRAAADRAARRIAPSLCAAAISSALAARISARAARTAAAACCSAAVFAPASRARARRPRRAPRARSRASPSRDPLRCL